MTIKVTINNRPIRPENITVIQPSLPLVERLINWDTYRNRLAMRGDYVTVVMTAAWDAGESEVAA